MLLKTCDVPSAKYVCMADREAKKFLQYDGSLLVQLERALYSLPESGKLWHEPLKEKLKSVGYVQMDGDSCIWRYVIKKDGRVNAVSFLLINVDDIMHIYKGTQVGQPIRDRLHKE